MIYWLIGLFLAVLVGLTAIAHYLARGPGDPRIGL